MTTSQVNTDHKNHPEPTQTQAPSAVGLWSSSVRPFTLAVVVLVSTGAFLNRATVTLLPGVAEELGGHALFGAAVSLPMASAVVMTGVMACLGRRVSERVAIVVGAVLLMCAAGSLVWVSSFVGLIVARCVMGMAEAVMDIGTTALIARQVPSSLRPKMYAMFATLWMVPSLVGPVCAEFVASAAGWRVAYMAPTALLVLAIPAVCAIREGASQLADGDRTRSGSPRELLVSAVALAAGVLGVAVAAYLAGQGRVVVALAVGVVGIGVVVVSTWRALPRGTFALRPGVPGVIAIRTLVQTCFSPFASYLALLLTLLYGLRPSLAAASLVVNGVAWAAGSNFAASKWTKNWDDGVRLQRGLLLLAVSGVAGITMLTALPLVPVGLALWGVAGFGMGVTSNTSMSLVAGLSSDDTVVRNKAALSQGMSAAVALSSGVLGMGMAVVGTDHVRVLFTVVFACASVTLVALAFSAKHVANCGRL